MKYIHIITFAIIFSISKIFSTNKDDGKIKINNVYLENTEERKINAEIEFKNSFDITNSYEYKIDDLIKEIEKSINNINEYSLHSYSKNNEEAILYNGYDDKIIVYKDSNIDLYFYKKKKCEIILNCNEKKYNKKNISLKPDFEYKYLKHEIENNFPTENIKLEIDYYLKDIKVNDKTYNASDKFKIEEDNSIINVNLNKYLNSKIKLNINSKEFIFDNLKIKEDNLNDESSLLLFLFTNSKKINNYENIKNDPNYNEFLKNYNNYILYNIIKGNEKPYSENKDIDFNDIKNYLKNNENPILTINIKDYINIKIKINNINNLKFKKSKINELVNLRNNLKCKRIRDFKKKIIETLKIEQKDNVMEIYKKENNEEKLCSEDELLKFNETYIIKFSDRFIKNKKEENDNKNKDHNDTENKKKKKCLSSNK